MTRELSTTVVQPNWLTTTEGDRILKQLCIPGTSNKKSFGILEKPNISGSLEELSYKLFFVGKSTSDRPRIISELANTGGAEFHIDTNGIQKTNMYWPTKIWDKIILFRLQCWEAGETGIRKFSHILPACTEKADAFVFVFAFDDINSLHETSQNITKLKGSVPNEPAIIVIGTKFTADQNLNVSFSDMKEFESKWHLNVVRLQSSLDNPKNINRISPVLNFICEQLWIRDQEYMMRQSFDKFTFKK